MTERCGCNRIRGREDQCPVPLNGKDIVSRLRKCEAVHVNGKTALTWCQGEGWDVVMGGSDGRGVERTQGEGNEAE